MEAARTTPTRSGLSPHAGILGRYARLMFCSDPIRSVLLFVIVALRNFHDFYSMNGTAYKREAIRQSKTDEKTPHYHPTIRTRSDPAPAFETPSDHGEVRRE